MLKDSDNLLSAVADVLKTNVKGTVLIDKEGEYETGVSIELIDSESDKWILDGWSVDAFGSKKSLGLGVAKDLWKNDSVEIDAGVYATRSLKDFFTSKAVNDIKIGLSGTWRF